MRMFSSLVLAAMLLGAVPVGGGTAEPDRLVLASLSDEHMTPRPYARVETSLVCPFTSQQVAGLNRICYYDCNGSGTAMTIAATSNCPRSVYP